MDFVFTATALELLGGDPDHPLEPVIGFATAADDSGRGLVPVLVSDIGVRFDWNWLDRAKDRRVVRRADADAAQNN